VWGEEIESKYNNIDNQVRHIRTIIDDVIDKNTIGFEQDV
tara:strand:- start:224 stop:343 length:120 start_codon:yes stop_codon:yes gene_type:complete